MPEPKLIVPADFDMLVRKARPEHLWGLPVIAAAVGLSRDTVRRMVERGDDIPVSRPGGRYYAARSELLAWLRSGR